MNKSLAGGKNGRKSLKFWVPNEERGVILRVMRTCVWYSMGGDLGQAKELALHPVANAATTGSKASVLRGISLTEGKQQLAGGRWGHQGGRWLSQSPGCARTTRQGVGMLRLTPCTPSVPSLTGVRPPLSLSQNLCCDIYSHGQRSERPMVCVTNVPPDCGSECDVCMTL